MIGQYLSNTNESATISIFQNFLELNKAQVFVMVVSTNLENFFFPHGPFKKISKLYRLGLCFFPFSPFSPFAPSQDPHRGRRLGHGDGSSVDHRVGWGWGVGGAGESAAHRDRPAAACTLHQDEGYNMIQSRSFERRSVIPGQNQIYTTCEF